MFLNSDTFFSLLKNCTSLEFYACTKLLLLLFLLLAPLLLLLERALHPMLVSLFAFFPQSTFKLHASFIRLNNCFDSRFNLPANNRSELVEHLMVILHS